MVLNKDFSEEDDWEVVASEDPSRAALMDPDNGAQQQDNTTTPMDVEPPSVEELREEAELQQALEASMEENAIADPSPSVLEPSAPVEPEFLFHNITPTTATATTETEVVEPPSYESVAGSTDGATDGTSVEEAVKANYVKTDPATITPATTEDSKEQEKEPLLNQEDPTSTATTTDNQQEQQPPNNTPNNKKQLPEWLRGSITKLGQVIQEADQKHHFQSKARNSVKVVGDSLTHLGDSIQKEATTAKATLDRESVKLTKTIQTKADEVDWGAKTKVVEDKVNETVASVQNATNKLGEKVKTGAVKAGQSVKSGAAKAGEKAKSIQQETKLSDILAGAAVVAGAVLLAKGKPGAGAALFATGGAAYAAGEASQRRYDEGLNENLHIE